MQHYQIFSAIISIVFFVTAIYLVRRDTILPSSAIRWTLLSIIILIIGTFPQLTDLAAEQLGVGYAPIIPVIMACIILLLKALLSDVARAKDRVKLERLMQRVALLEQRINERSRSDINEK
ncbi:DUF2304 domain-containing protein [Shewanella sp. Scap07]|uniref:DUF2304 domain-containing protein n=1 Tax=Shewanella sp. Scap07 TaxID=2589987 RepID=UPI0015B7C2A0|nr:DUF2304 domain-containing protein [Shewanella sp. Scap07]QLE86102.1 DUF2304 domain-containing protein [Shewanella sp. Scap07]